MPKFKRVKLEDVILDLHAEVVKQDFIEDVREEAQNLREEGNDIDPDNIPDPYMVEREDGSLLFVVKIKGWPRSYIAIPPKWWRHKP